MTAGFEQLARLREARAFHPVGRVAQARLELSRIGSALVRELGPGTHPAVVRLSRGIGLPAESPDLLGLAVRVTIGDRPFDLLLTTTAAPAWARWLVLPARSWTSRPYSTVLPYDTGDDRILITLSAETDWAPSASLEALDAVTKEQPMAFAVRESHHGVVGRLVIERVGDDEDIAFDPMLHARRNLRPINPLSALREAAYRGSRSGRHETES